MLDALRKGAGTWVAKIFIALLVMSFAIWGVADVFQGFGQNVVASVGDTEISTYSFDRAYRQELNRVGQQIGRPLSTTEGAQLGLPQQVLGTLVAQAAMNETARQMKLGISDTQLSTVIQEDPAFQRAGGGYDRNRLEQLLRNSGMTEDEFVLERRALAERQQLAEGIAGDVIAPKALVEAFHVYQAEARNLSFLRLDASLLGEIADPDPATLNTYYDENKSQYRAPEYRKVTVLELTPDALARPDEVTDEDARAEYDRGGDRYFQPERRKVRQLSYPNAEDAAAAGEKLASGTTFDELMADQSLTDNDVYLGLMAKADFLDSAIGDAAFALEQGATSNVVKGRFSSVILNILEVQPEQTQPFEEVKDELKSVLARENAEREVLDLLDEIEDARAGGALLPEVAERFQLTTTSPDAFASTGKDLTENDVSLPEAEGLVAGAFASDIGVENDPLQVGSNGFLWYDVTEVIPARDRDLDEVRARVVADWKNAETEKRLQEKATKLVERAKAGADLATLAGEDGLTVQKAGNVRRTGASGEISQAAAELVFAGPVGSVLDAATADGSARLVIKTDATTIPPFDGNDGEVQEVQNRFGQQLQDSLLNQYVSDIEMRAGIEVNEAAIARLIGLGTN